MSGGRVRRVRASTNVRLPSVSLPTLTYIPRNPPGWNTTEVSVRSRGLPGVTNNLQKPEPAGDPPQDWTGTRPEWAVWWALIRKGLKPGQDFFYESLLAGVSASYYSQIDFLIPKFFVGIEVQGTYWHYGQGRKKMAHDLIRLRLFAEQGIKVIFIDEKDALSDPEHYVDQALKGIDESQTIKGYL